MLTGLGGKSSEILINLRYIKATKGNFKMLK
jgi:hypothetical protein